MSENWQLFIDDHVVARNTGLKRVVHHPRALGLVIPADKPWETSGVGPIYVGRREDGTFFAYYTAIWWDLDSASKLPKSFRMDRAHHMFVRIACATSKDGINWKKPNLGLVDAPAGVDWERHYPYPSPVGSSRNNNLGVPFIVVADLGRDGNVKDRLKRYVLRLAPGKPGEPAGVGASWSYAPEGYFALDLPDFLHDPDWKGKLSPIDGQLSPRRRLLHFWDDVHKEWVAMDQGVVPHWLPSRDIARFSSKDLKHWNSMVALYPDASDPNDPHYYDEPMAITPFAAEGIIFGLLSWFHSDRTYPWGGPNLEASDEHPNVWPFCRKGTNEMRITISRDGGMTWDRTSSREAWIPHGSEEDSYDRLVISPIPPIRVEDEDWFYVGVIDSDHLGIRNDPKSTPYNRERLGRHQIALYVQKHNRYVSMTAKNQAEVLITKPMEVDGDKLQLNVDASRGELRAGIASSDPIPTFGGTTPSTAPHLLEENMLPGFGFDDCQPIYHDSIEYTVVFKNNSDLSPLQGNSICILFQMFNADLYGFRIL